MKQLKIVVLCGGLSTERNISFLTGSRVCQALRSRGHKAVLADLFMGFEEMDNTDRGGSASESAFDPEILFEDLPPIPEYTFDGTAPDLDAVRRSRKWGRLRIWTRYEGPENGRVLPCSVCMSSRCAGRRILSLSPCTERTERTAVSRLPLI